jgi:Uncharacterised nucleotidyltransferase
MGGLEADSRLTQLWEATDRLLDGATLAGVLAHRLGPLAAHRLRRLGDPVPKPLVLEERAASVSMFTAVPLLERIRASYDGPLVLIKGPEIAMLYPGRARRFADLDLLTERAESMHAALVATGFLEMEDPEFELTPEHHHLQPLRWPAIPLTVELHKSPNWPVRAPRPPVGEIYEARVPSVLGVDGVFAATPLHHALILAMHAWRHEPLQTLRDLVDVAVVAASLDERELDRTAHRWGIGRVWRTTVRAIDAVFYGGRMTRPLRSWARHLTLVRERSVFEGHLERLLHGYWELPPHLATSEFARALYQSITPLPGETWQQKLGRIQRALRDPGAPVGGRESLPARRDPPDA